MSLLATAPENLAMRRTLTALACAALLFSGEPAAEEPMHTAIVAAGCFWGVEDAFAKTPGVSDAVSGYLGGSTDNPTYRAVCGDTTGHAEAVRITFDPSVISYAQLLDVFWNIHDPTQVDRQGPDHGTQYRSAIFATSAQQLAAAQESKTAAQVYFAKPIATQIVDAAAIPFWPAEDYHQDYLAKNGGECHTRRRGLQVVTARLTLSDVAWKARLTPDQYRILRHGGTEAPFCEAYTEAKNHGAGIYRCAGCRLELFTSQAKFDSGTGWPSFSAGLPGRVDELEDAAHGMVRTEVRCFRCGGHLGHVFDDGPAPTGRRFCINGASLVFEPGE